MIVELICVGTELLLGNIINTNANYLSKKCAELGLSLYYQIAVGDNETRLSEVLETALTRSDIVILTGGLGPTKDDITKEVAAKVLFRNLVEDNGTKDRLLSYFQYRFGREKVQSITDITENNWKQFMVIEDSIVVENEYGTAPGFIVEAENKRVILLPGPPSEMIPMFHDKIMPYLRSLQNQIYYSKMVKICGIGESQAETMIIDLIDQQTNPTIAPYAKSGEVHFRITASADKLDKAKELIHPVVKELEKRFGDYIYTTEEDETLEEVVVKLLKKNNLTLSTAESCTGGLFTGRIVNVPGVSDILKEGYITYSNEAKMKNLGVGAETLRTYGAVSEQCAREMAIGACAAASSDTAIAITGIAGPDGGNELKPVGLVYIACNIRGKVSVNQYIFKGDREKVRYQSVISALDLLRRQILNTFHS